MSGPTLDRTVRVAGPRITAALAARFRSLDLAEDGLAEACVRAAESWPAQGAPGDPAAWLYRVAERWALDRLRHRRVADSHRPPPPAPDPTAEEVLADDARRIPDERLRLIFVCCHPALAPDVRAALTLRLVCGLSTAAVAAAFLVPEATLAQRLVRAKRKIAQAGIPFAVPGPEAWPERLDAVLTTLDLLYTTAHAEAAATEQTRETAAEVLHLARLLTRLIPASADTHALAALVCYAEGRRPARVDGGGVMVPLAEQDPRLWDWPRITEGSGHLARALALCPPGAPRGERVLRAVLHALWCGRESVDQPPPWPALLAVYDGLLAVRGDAVVRLNRAVVLAEVAGPDAALQAVEELGLVLDRYQPYHAVRAALLHRLDRRAAALAAYDAALALGPGAAERRWLERRREAAGCAPHHR